MLSTVIKRSLSPTLTLTMSDRARVAKRRRVGTIGAPSEADEVVTPVNLPSATAFSTRTVKDNRVLPLTVVCARVFAASLPRLSKDSRQWEPSKKWKVVAAELKKLPDSIVQTLFTMPMIWSKRYAHRPSIIVYSTVQIVASISCAVAPSL